MTEPRIFWEDSRGAERDIPEKAVVVFCLNDQQCLRVWIKKDKLHIVTLDKGSPRHGVVPFKDQSEC